MKLFKNSNTETVRYCQKMFNFETPGEQRANRTIKILQKYSSLDQTCVNVLVVIDYVILLDYNINCYSLLNNLVLLSTVVLGLFAKCYSHLF